ncbi:uncharacterized protein LOC129571631, partial [Sitodiplosis mosellana]|uniref:uncharacterized protein LOC129571631 n=1 Tax=Sitodiplosis mosellana TaxID=263140 RepID=UPI002443EF92
MDRQATYICLFCLPKKVHFTGYGPLRMHLRTQHSVKRQSTTESNRFRSDGGYMLDETHYFPNSPGFEPWRATGHGVKPVPPPAPASQTSSKVEMSPTELSSMIVTIMSQMSNQVQAGVGNTIQNAASMLSFMGATPAINQATTSRCFYPVPNTNNVLVAISNPPVAVPENMPALQFVAAPEKNYITTSSAEEHARTSGKSTEEESDTFTEDIITTPTIDPSKGKVEILSSETLAVGQGAQVSLPNEKSVEPNTASSQVDTVNQDEVTVEEILSELE